jgi:hypothetical protein
MSFLRDNVVVASRNTANLLRQVDITHLCIFALTSGLDTKESLSECFSHNRGIMHSLVKCLSTPGQAIALMPSTHRSC